MVLFETSGRLRPMSPLGLGSPRVAPRSSDFGPVATRRSARTSRGSPTLPAFAGRASLASPPPRLKGIDSLHEHLPALAGELPSPHRGEEVELRADRRDNSEWGLDVLEDLDTDIAKMTARHQGHVLPDDQVEAELQYKQQLFVDRQVLHLSRRRLVGDPLAPVAGSASAFDCLASGLPVGEKHKLMAYDSILSMCNHYESRLHEQHGTMVKMEHKCWINTEFEKRIGMLEETLAEREAQIAQLQKDLKSGKPVEMSAGAKDEVEEALESTLSSLKAEARSQDLSDEEKAALAAMPGWSLEKWMESISVKAIITESILNHIRGAGAVVNSQVELRFMQQLGKAGSRDTVIALLRSSTMINDLADALWKGIMELKHDFDSSSKGPDPKVEAAKKAQKEAEAKAMEEKESLENEVAMAEEKRQEAKKEREKLREEAREEAQQTIEELANIETKVSKELQSARETLESARAENAPPDVLLSLEGKLEAAEEAVEDASAAVLDAKETEGQREAEAAKEDKKIEMEDAAARQREEAKMKEAKAKIKSAMMDIEGSGARQLSYAPPAVFFAGLGTIVGRCGAEPEEYIKLQMLMEHEHVRAPGMIAKCSIAQLHC